MHRWFESKAITQAYAKYRPQAPDFIKERSIKFLQERSPLKDQTKHDLLLDIGCGSGQTSQTFSYNFRKIIGVDPSRNQITEAERRNSSGGNIEYRLGTDGHLPAETHSADMVIVGQAVHWFEFDKFYKECARVLKPNGCLMIYGYDRPRVALRSEERNHQKFSRQKVASDGLIEDFLDKCHYDERSQLVEDHYLDIFFDLKADYKVYTNNLSMSKPTTMQGYIEHLASFSGYQNFVSDKLQELKQGGSDEEVLSEKLDIRKELRNSLKKCWEVENVADEDVQLVSTWQMFMIMSQKPNY